MAGFEDYRHGVSQFTKTSKYDVAMNPGIKFNKPNKPKMKYAAN